MCVKLLSEDLKPGLYPYTSQVFILMEWPSHQRCAVVDFFNFNTLFYNTPIKTSIFFTTSFKYYFFIIFYSFFFHPLSLVSLSLSPPFSLSISLSLPLGLTVSTQQSYPPQFQRPPQWLETDANQVDEPCQWDQPSRQSTLVNSTIHAGHVDDPRMQTHKPKPMNSNPQTQTHKIARTH